MWYVGHPNDVKDDEAREARTRLHQERDFKAARTDIQGSRGRQFDPAVVDAFCSRKPEEWERIRYETTKFLPAMETFSQLYNHPVAPLKD